MLKILMDHDLNLYNMGGKLWVRLKRDTIVTPWTHLIMKSISLSRSFAEAIWEILH